MSRNGGGKEDGGDLGGGAWRRGLRPLEVRATLRRERGKIQAPNGCLGDWKRGLIPAPSHSHPDPKSSSSGPALDLPRPLRGAPGTPMFLQVGNSSRCAYTAVEPGTARGQRRPARTPGPVSASEVQPPSPPGLPRLPPGPRGAALTAQQEEEAERCQAPRASRRELRAAGGALCPERGHRAASRRGGAVALSRARAGAPISPAQAPGSRAASSQGLGRLRPRGGRGRRPGPAGWRGSRCPTRAWRPPLPPAGRRWPTLSSSSPCGAGQLPS